MMTVFVLGLTNVKNVCPKVFKQAERMIMNCKTEVPLKCNLETKKQNTNNEKKDQKKGHQIKCIQYNEMQNKQQNCKVDERQKNPECCKVPCPDMADRYDDQHYRISDKAIRKYQQTWVECPELRIVKRPICCYEKMEAVPFVKRERKALLPTTATAQSKVSEEFMKCARNQSDSKESGCPRMCMPPPCKCGRVPPRCARTAISINCVKICTPYPSFSECNRPKLPKPNQCECEGLDGFCK